MSPASSGALEIERYVGACLISSQQSRHKTKILNVPHAHTRNGSRYHHHHHHHHHQQQQQQQQRCNSENGWAGGMPLISFSNHQAWRRHHHENNPLARLAVHTQGAPLILSNRYNQRKKHHHHPSPKLIDSVKTDAVSVTSDESSGSANSENCLPRIIKPRKRRKKDRKPPPHLLRPVSQDGSFSTDSTSPDLDFTFMPYFPYAYDFPSYKTPTENFDSCGDIPNLHHSFEDIQDFDVNGNQTESSCQCRYCDPEGQIWDIDRSCYSPYLTSPNQNTFQYPESTNLLSKSYSSSSVSSCIAENMAALSLDDDGGKTTATVSNLEVSTEIVTSLNGHRDLEIKFFSARDVNVTCVDKDDADSVRNRKVRD